MTENRHYKALELDKILTMLAEQTGCLFELADELLFPPA